MTWLTSTEALALLGVKPQTLYANVSRGRIRARPHPGDSRQRLYSEADIVRLAKRRRGKNRTANVAAGTIKWGDPMLSSAISTVARGRLIYRGKDAVALAETVGLEEIAALLWETPSVTFISERGADKTSEMPSLQRAFTTIAARAAMDLPTRGRTLTLLRKEAEELMAELAEALIGSFAPGTPLDLALAHGWQVPGAQPLIRKSLALLADHELNASTFAARVAASTGASLAGCLLAGMATLTGPLHGGAARGVQALLRTTKAIGARAAVTALLEQGLTIPGFGHPLYPEGDIRARTLLADLDMPDICLAVRAVVGEMTGELPNVDFALAALAARYSLNDETPLLLFVQGRAVGWLAHALEQIVEGDLIRPRARYSGVLPA